VRQLTQGKTARNLDILARRIQGSADTARSLCLATVRDDGGLDSPSLLEFQKWGVQQDHQIRIVPDAESSDLEFVRKAAAALDSEAAAR
jgi:hypothetical protein